VCAGNPITSQRITDVILGAFQSVAASQGCCNIISFGMGGRDASGKETPGFGGKLGLIFPYRGIADLPISGRDNLWWEWSRANLAWHFRRTRE